MVNREFNDASIPKPQEHQDLPNWVRKKLKSITYRQWAALRRLRKEQQERNDRDMVQARKEIVTQHNTLTLKPTWEKGGPMSRDKIEMLAAQKVRANNYQECDQLNATFEQEKAELINRAYQKKQKTVNQDKDLIKRYRKATRTRSRGRDIGGRGR